MLIKQALLLGSGKGKEIDGKGLVFDTKKLKMYRMDGQTKDFSDCPKMDLTLSHLGLGWA